MVASAMTLTIKKMKPSVKTFSTGAEISWKSKNQVEVSINF